MISSIRKYWQHLESAVHPEDAPVFASHPRHTFNLDFPPPAFIGDVDNAPVVILLLNGGYDPDKTPAEFARPTDCIEFLDWLKGTRTAIPTNLSAYYTQQAVFPWVREGSAVIVNAVAYRSPKITDKSESENRNLAKLLPSTKVHNLWLRDELLPDVRNGKRCLVAHRWSLWDFGPETVGPLANVHFSRAPASPYLSNDLKAEIGSWLAGRDRA